MKTFKDGIKKGRELERRDILKGMSKFSKPRGLMKLHCNLESYRIGFIAASAVIVQRIKAADQCG